MNTEIKEFTVIEAAISELTAKYNYLPDCSTDAGLEIAKVDYKSIRTYEINLEKARKILVEGIVKTKKTIDSEARIINDKLRKISGPFKSAIDHRVEEIRLAEIKRRAALREEIQGIKNFIIEASNKSSVQISEIIEAIDQIEVDEHFSEFQAEAREVLNSTKGTLSELLGAQLQKEDNEEKLTKEREENQRLANELKAEREELEQLRKENSAREAGRIAKESAESREAETSQSKVVDDILSTDQEDVPHGTIEDVKGFLEWSANDAGATVDFGNLFISNDPRHHEEALHNIRNKFTNYIKEEDFSDVPF